MQHVNVSLCSSLPMSNRSKKKMLRKTSYQKTKEEFESVKEKQKNKKEVQFFTFSIKALRKVLSQVKSVGLFSTSGIFFLHIGVFEEQGAERRSYQEVQTEENGDISDAEQKDEEGAAQPEPTDGIPAPEDSRDRAGKMTQKNGRRRFQIANIQLELLL